MLRLRRAIPAGTALVAHTLDPSTAATQQTADTPNVFPLYGFDGEHILATGPLIYDAAAIRARDVQDHESAEWSETFDTTNLVVEGIQGNGDEEGITVQNEASQSFYLKFATATFWRIEDMLKQTGEPFDELLASKGIHHHQAEYFGESWLPNLLSTSYADGAKLEHVQVTFGANLIESLALAAFRMAGSDRRLASAPLARELQKMKGADKQADMALVKRRVLNGEAPGPLPVVTRAAKYMEVLGTFVFAHEMGHHVLAHFSDDPPCSEGRKNKELQADSFAVATIVAMMSPAQIRSAIGAAPQAEFPVRAALDGFSTFVLPYLGAADGCAYLPRPQRRAAITSTFDQFVRLRATAFDKLQTIWTRSPAGVGWLVNHKVELTDLRMLNKEAATRCGPPYAQSAARPRDFIARELQGTSITLVYVPCTSKVPDLSSLTAADRNLIGARHIDGFRHYYEVHRAWRDEASLQAGFLVGLRTAPVSFSNCDFQQCPQVTDDRPAAR